MQNSNTNLPQNKINFTIKSDENESYKFTVFNEEDDITLILENLKEFPIKIYELKISLKKLKEMDESFCAFLNAQKFINNGIKKLWNPKNIILLILKMKNV